jgi:acyl-CoA hydrolase
MIKMVVCGVEVWVRRQGPGERLKAAAADFTVVAVDDDGWPRPLTGVT